MHIDDRFRLWRPVDGRMALVFAQQGAHRYPCHRHHHDVFRFLSPQRDSRILVGVPSMPTMPLQHQTDSHGTHSISISYIAQSLQCGG